MAYLKIENLYRRPELLECYALEKVHGTSSNITYKNDVVTFFAGGAAHTQFTSLFDQDALLKSFRSNVRPDQRVVVHGEAFGGKMQGMSHVYGKQLKFIAFDVNIDGTWLDVPSAEGLVTSFGLDFVPYERGRNSNRKVVKCQKIVEIIFTTELSNVRNNYTSHKKYKQIVELT